MGMPVVSGAVGVAVVVVVVGVCVGHICELKASGG